MSKIWHFYDEHYKALLLIPLLILFLSIVVIGFHVVKTGDFINKGVTLKGGSTITVQTDQGYNSQSLRTSFEQILPGEDVQVRTLASAGKSTGFIIETTSLDTEKMKDFVKKNFQVSSINVETVGPSLGESFFKQAMYSVAVAFILMSLVILLYFRSLVPSSYVILAAISDILFAWAMLIVLDVKISTAGIAAFLMLIGYSVDTDILLTTRVLKREGSILEKIKGAYSTGIVMTLAAMVATGIAYFATSSEVLKQIMLILFLGLCADIWNTWLQNAALLRMYVERKMEKAQ